MMSNQLSEDREDVPALNKRHAVRSFVSIAVVAAVSLGLLTSVVVLLLMQSLSLPLPQIKTVVVFFHVLGLVLGMGAALLLDLFLVRYTFFRRIDQSAIDVARFGSKIVTIGLLLLWVTGLGFLWIYAMSDPGKLANLKIYAKMTIVSLLTINGVLIHYFAIPSLEKKRGMYLWDRSSTFKILCDILLASVSIVCWISATYMGLSKEMNFAAGYYDYMLGFLCLLNGALGTAFGSYLLLLFVKHWQQFGIARARRRSATIHY